MDPREQDTREKLDALERALAGGATPDQLFALASSGMVAVEFRSTDAMIGIPEVDGDLVHRLRDASYRALVKAADHGHTKAALALAERIWQDRDEAFAARAARALERTADAEPTGRANHLLALFHFHGLGVLDNKPASIALHEKAAACGNADSMFELYAMLSQGIGAEADLPRALEWCRRAAEAGNARAMYNLGAFHATGRDVPKDDALAVEWYTRAAEAGHGRAAATAGVMLASGRGARRDVARGRKFLERAEELGTDWRPLAAALGLDEDAVFADAAPVLTEEKPSLKKAGAKKKAPAKKAAPKKPAAKKPAPKKPAARKPAPKKPAAKKPRPKKAATKRAPTTAAKKKKRR